MRPSIPPAGQWCCYLLRCRAGELYCGISNDLEKRLQRHQRGDGSKYVSGRLPFTLVWVELQPDKWCAMARERAIKKMRASAKRALVAQQPKQ